MIDYGAVVIKNGKVINEDQFFMKMGDAVGCHSFRVAYTER